jgi:hypothetical protein
MNLRKKVHKLSFDYDNEFYLIGIASHENDYRISWALNKLLGWNLAKTDDFKINHPKRKVEVNYSMYHFADDYGVSYHLISNKSEKGFLLPDFKNIDYILKVSGEDNFNNISDLIQNIKKINIVITAFVIENLQSKYFNMFIF